MGEVVRLHGLHQALLTGRELRRILRIDVAIHMATRQAGGRLDDSPGDGTNVRRGVVIRAARGEPR